MKKRTRHIRPSVYHYAQWNYTIAIIISILINSTNAWKPLMLKQGRDASFTTTTKHRINDVFPSEYIRPGHELCISSCQLIDLREPESSVARKKLSASEAWYVGTQLISLKSRKLRRDGTFNSAQACERIWAVRFANWHANWIRAFQRARCAQNGNTIRSIDYSIDTRIIVMDSIKILMFTFMNICHC